MATFSHDDITSGHEDGDPDADFFYSDTHIDKHVKEKRTAANFQEVDMELHNDDTTSATKEKIMKSNVLADRKLVEQRTKSISMDSLEQVENEQTGQNITLQANTSGINLQQKSSQSNVSNYTTTSNGVKSIIIIKPVGEAGKTAITKPGLFCEAFEKSAFSRVEVEDVRTNKRKGLFSVELKNKPNDQELKAILETTVLGPWKVECYMPDRSKYKYGVINPIDVDTDLNILKQ